MNKYWAAKLQDKRVVRLTSKGISSDLCKVSIKHSRGKQILLILNRVIPSKFKIGDVITNHYCLYVVTDSNDFTYSLTKLTKTRAMIPGNCCYINKTEEYEWTLVLYKGKKLQQVLNLD